MSFRTEFFLGAKRREKTEREIFKKNKSLFLILMVKIRYIFFKISLYACRSFVASGFVRNDNMVEVRGIEPLSEKHIPTLLHT